MNLCEVMVASAVFAVAAAAALQVCSRSTAALVRAEQQQQHLVRLHAALEHTEVRLRRLAAEGPQRSCAEARQRMVQLQVPAATGLEQRWRAEGDALLLELGPAPGRQRLLHPVAYGLCSAEP